jgi:hypothetical protein
MNFKFDEKALSERSAIWNMPSFLETYTLHDSSLYECHVRSSADLLVFIDWDLYWNKAISSEYNLLVIRFAKNYWVKWLEGAWRQPTLDEAKSEVISAAEREQMLTDERFNLRAYQNEHNGFQAPMMDASLTRTVFDFMNWGECEILHSAEVSFACFDESGNLGEIPFEDAANL